MLMDRKSCNNTLPYGESARRKSNKPSRKKQSLKGSWEEDSAISEALTTYGF